MDQNVERRIRDRAYSIWEEEGCPTGRDVDHWLRAAQEIAAEEGRPEEPGDAGTAAPAEKPKRARSGARAAVAEKASGKGAEAGSGADKGAEVGGAEAGGAEIGAGKGKTAEPAPKSRRSSKS